MKIRSLIALVAFVIFAFIAAPARAYVPEIYWLARALWYDPDRIYQYVYNNIDTLPRFGSLKGPVGALIDRSGTSFDQAELMFELLKQSGYMPTYQLGTINLTAAQLTNWLGVDTSYAGVAGLLANGTFPGQVNGNPVVTSVDIGWAWVAVPINGTTYMFDPATKSYNWKNSLNIASIMGYTQSNFLNDMRVGAANNNSQAGSLNRTNIRNDLVTYSNNLVNYLNANMPAASTEDVIGGKTIQQIPVDTHLRQTSLPYVSSCCTPQTATSIDDYFRTTVTIALATSQNVFGTQATFKSADIYGRRLSIFFDSSNRPVLYLDGTAVPNVIGGPAFGTPASTQVLVYIGFLNQTIAARQFTLQASPGAYVLATGFGPVSRGMIERYRRVLRQTQASSPGSTAEPSLALSLEVLAGDWLAEVTRMINIVDRFEGTLTQQLYSIGFVGLRPIGSNQVAPYVDFPLVSVGVNQLNGRPVTSGMSTIEKIAFNALGTAGSIFESSTIEQSQPSAVAVSTAKLMDMTMAPGGIGIVFDINNGFTVSGTTVNNASYYNSTIRPQLVSNGYSAVDLSRIDSMVNSGFRVLAPKKGNMTNTGWSWSGTGYFGITQSLIAAVISGGLSGGFTTSSIPPFTFESAIIFDFNPDAHTHINTTYAASKGGHSGLLDKLGDPINMVTGDFTYDHTDLSVGSGKEFPYRLDFTRSYDSGNAPVKGALGYGWTHNFAITALQDSDGFAGMGANSPISGSSAIAALYVMTDMFNWGGSVVPAENIVTSSIAAQWLSERLTNNVANITRPGNVEQFVKLTNGVWQPPIGSASTLTGSAGSFVYKTKDQVTLNFNSAGNIATWQAPGGPTSGPTVTFNYNGSQLTSVSTSMGRVLSLTYDANSRISGVSDGNGRSVAYTYDGTGNIATYKDPANNTTTYNYSQPGRLTKIFYPSQPSNAFITNNYDDFGRVVQQFDAAGNWTWLDIAGSMSAIETPDGASHFYYFSPRGKTVLEIDELGNKTANEYDALDRLTKTTMPEGDSVVYAYDTKHNVTSITHNPKPGSALSPTVQSFTYDSTYNKVKTATDAKGNVTTYTYDAATGNLTAIDQPTVANTAYVYTGGSPPLVGTDHPSTPHQSFTYNARGQVLTATDALGKVTQYVYASAKEDLLQVTDDYGSGRLNIVTQYAYDGIGNITGLTDPNGNVTNTTFDLLRRPTQITYPASTGAVTKFTYDADDNLTQTQKATGLATPNNWQTTSTTYTPAFKPLNVYQPDGSFTAYTYDVRLRPITVTDPEGRIVKNVYNLKGQIASLHNIVMSGGNITQDTTLESRAYTPNGKQASLTDANNNVTTYGYDGLDRLSQTTFSGGSAETYSYDANANMTTKTMRNGLAITMIYDTLNRMVRKIAAPKTVGDFFTYDNVGHLVDGGNSIGHSLLTYDTAGRKVTEQWNGGDTITSAYDQNSNRTYISFPTYATFYTFDALNRMVDVKEGSTVMVHYAYDPLSRRTSITYGNGQQLAYTYGANNDITRMVLSSSAGGLYDLQYTYNHAHQRLNTWVSNPVYQWRPASALSLAYAPNALNQYATVGSATLSYDANGNLSGDGVNTYVHDTENLLTGVNPASTNITYTPDALRRIATKWVGAPVYEYYSYDGDREIQIRPPSGTGGVKRYIYGAGLDEPVVILTDALSNITLKQYAHPDALGSTIALTDTSGALVDRYAYGPFGESVSLAGFPSRFTGRKLDANTGLYNYRARTYSPALGRFLQPDPIGTSGGVNLYAYVNNDPLNLTDPQGLMVNSAFKATTNFLSSLTGSIFGASSAFEASDASTGVLQLGLSVQGVGGNAYRGAESGIAFDTHGNFATYSSGSLGGGVGLEAAATLHFGISPTLRTVNDLRGPAFNAGVATGRGVAIGYDESHAIDGSVTYGLSLGLGFGSSAQAGGSYTYAMPPINVTNNRNRAKNHSDQ